MEKGVYEEMTPEEVVASIENIDISQITSGKEHNADLNMILKAAQVLADMSTELRGPQRMRLNTDVQEKKMRLARVTQQRNKDEVLEIEGRSAQQAAEGQEDKTLTKLLDHVRKCLRNVLKQRQSQSIGYYEFILHPTSLDESVENAFYMSFLLKDGYVRLKVDDESGCMPIIELVSKQDRQRRYQQNDQSEIATTQHIPRLSQDIWEALVELLNIREPLITPLAA